VPDFRVIPSIDELRRRPAVRALEVRVGAAATVDALRAAADAARRGLSGGTTSWSSDEAVVAFIERETIANAEAAFRPSLRTVLNATGVVIHTNLGRAPLARAAIDRVAEIAASYSTLEYDAGHGRRSRRDTHAEPLLRKLTGAEAAVVVNNNAAATLLCLAALAAGREVIVSRGELVEIGGGFRIPDVMAQSGAILREVGTTNKTRAADYAAAVTDRTALVLRVHPSNFRIEGFTERPALPELVGIGRRLNVSVMEDLGSGLLEGPSGSTRHPLASAEPSVEASIAAGVDICCFSGDKLLGGPQAGIIAGREALVSIVRMHPLMRALRVDKLTYAALDATLVEYLAGRSADTIPVQRMLAMPADAIRLRAESLAHALARRDGWRAEVIAGTSATGGGSAPGVELPTYLVAVEKAPLSADALEAQLRGAAIPIIARVQNDRVLLDLRTILPEQDALLLDTLASL
jgi:L-seryl-tRNA(Ser) seleniumtransferase